jgi:hypothetical protein
MFLEHQFSNAKLKNCFTKSLAHPIHSFGWVFIKDSLYRSSDMDTPEVPLSIGAAAKALSISTKTLRRWATQAKFVQSAHLQTEKVFPSRYQTHLATRTQSARRKRSLLTTLVWSSQDQKKTD